MPGQPSGLRRPAAHRQTGDSVRAQLRHGLEGLARTQTPTADAVGVWLGANGTRFVAAAIAISTFGFLDLAILAPTRVYYAMAADGAFFPAVARLHPKFQTPTLAIVLQSAWAILLTMTGTYEQLVTKVVFADWIFFGLTVGGLFMIRRRMGETEMWIGRRLNGHSPVNVTDLFRFADALDVPARDLLPEQARV